MVDDVALVFDCGSTNAAVIAVDCQGQIVESEAAAKQHAEPALQACFQQSKSFFQVE